MKEKRIFALGFFDGVHRGHQALLAACRHLAQQNNCRAGGVTFDSHPEALVKGTPPLLINTVADRQRLLQEYGMESVQILPFDKKLMATPWSAFLDRLVDQDAAGFVCGDDFRFGNRGEGTAEKLQAYCIQRDMPCTVVPEQLEEGVRVSSTHIRTLLEMGDLEQANRFLGHPHRLTGTVIPGRQLGRTIGIPTANLALPEYLVRPKFGVYACTTVIDGKPYAAVTNIGTRPTVEGHHVTVEPWILHFDGDLYGRELTLHFHKFLRPEQKFRSLEELQKQVRSDAQTTQKLLTEFIAP